MACDCYRIEFEGQQQYQVFVSIFNIKTLEASLFNLLFCFCFCFRYLFSNTHTPFFFICSYFIFIFFSCFLWLCSFIACYWAMCVHLCVCACYIPYNPIHISHHRMNCNMAFVHIFFNFFSLFFPPSCQFFGSITWIWYPVRAAAFQAIRPNIIANRSKITTTV